MENNKENINKVDISQAKAILNLLNEETKGEIFLSLPIEGTEEKAYYLNFLVIKRDYSNEIRDLLNDYSNCIIRDKENFFIELEKYAFTTWDEFIKRQKMHYIYNTKVGIPKRNEFGEIIGEKLLDLYDMSNLKLQTVHGLYNEEYFKEIPDWMKDIKRFTKLVFPIDLQTVYLFNEQEKQLYDMRKEELIKLEE